MGIMNIGTILSIRMCYEQVGTDQFGNKYYKEKKANSEGLIRRCVLYKGIAEPTKIPPMWHSWLHYITDEIPSNDKKYDWQIEHELNKTGTDMAYLPSGHLLKGGKRDKVFSDYQAWDPSAAESGEDK